MSDGILNERIKAALLQCDVATIANVLLKHGIRNVCLFGLSPLQDQQAHFVGPAYTLRFIPSRDDIDSIENYLRDDNLHRRAIEECPAGSVLMIDAMGCVSASSAGSMMATRLKVRGVAGIVTDGGFRDTSGIIKSGLPAFQRMPAPPATPVALHPVELNTPIGCAGVAVYPGDIIVGDSEGVAVIPQNLVEDVANEALAATEYEQYAELRIKQGHPLFGLFPGTPESMQDFEDWKAAENPGRKIE